MCMYLQGRLSWPSPPRTRMPAPDSLCQAHALRREWRPWHSEAFNLCSVECAHMCITCTCTSLVNRLCNVRSCCHSHHVRVHTLCCWCCLQIAVLRVGQVRHAIQRHTAGTYWNQGKKHMYKYCMLTTPTYGLDVLRLALHVCMYMSYGPAKQAAVSGGAVCPAGRFLSPRSDGLFQAGRHRPHAHRPPRRGPRDRQPRLLHGQRLRLLDERLCKYMCTRVWLHERHLLIMMLFSAQLLLSHDLTTRSVGFRWLSSTAVSLTPWRESSMTFSRSRRSSGTCSSRWFARREARRLVAAECTAYVLVYSCLFAATGVVVLSGAPLALPCLW